LNVPRIRSIKPEFFTDADICDLSPMHRLLFAGLWCHADRAGRLEDRPRELKAKLFPYDACDVDAMLWDLATAKGGLGFIVRYQVGTKRYIECRNFPKHQHPHRDEKASTMPAPCEHGASIVQPPHEHGASTPVSCLLSPVSGLLSLEIAGDSANAPAAKAIDEPLVLEEPEQPRARKEKSKRAKEAERATDPRHAPLLKALTETYKRETGATLPWATRIPRDVASLLGSGLEPSVIEAAWARALNHAGFPTVRTPGELVQHLAHFVGTGPPSTAARVVDIRRSPVRAEDIPKEAFAVTGDVSDAF
jgi:hypothetical protein